MAVNAVCSTNSVWITNIDANMAAVVRAGFCERVFCFRSQVGLCSPICNAAYSGNVRRKSYAIQYTEFGDPNKVLQKVEVEREKVGPEDVGVKVLAAPINPADINIIQGTYGVKPKLPAIAGLEGVAQVTEVGSNVKNLSAGNWVLMPGDKMGTWRQHGVANHKKFRKISDKLGLVTAATLTVNPPTAYRMLSDFVKLEPGDTFIQNGANSGVGQAAIQIGKCMGLKSINVVRNRPNLEELKKSLQALGADHVVTEEDLRTDVMKNVLSAVPPPRLGLNCVGGKATSDMMRHLANDATIVTYGGMSRQPLTVSVAALIFKNLKAVGFWRTHWAKLHSMTKVDDEMYDFLTRIALDGKLRPPAHNTVPLDNFQEAVRKSMEAFTGAKQILVMDESGSV
ncbi:enoyl-[acyl-carrier-protein] reductase, mitochondrial-like [Ornithodoros turicata]|uniref:enoyl-[acyl-carrier-protein] reductase, mitochondrial-like n=1 Tax=Ornithodoros turicata TaxID=34597 RepID=UPI003139CEE9